MILIYFKKLKVSERTIVTSTLGISFDESSSTRVGIGVEVVAVELTSCALDELIIRATVRRIGLSIIFSLEWRRGVKCGVLFLRNEGGKIKIHLHLFPLRILISFFCKCYVAEKPRKKP